MCLKSVLRIRFSLKHKMLPWDVIRIIQRFLRWRERSKMVSRQWLVDAKLERAKLGKWRSKKLLYSYVRYLHIGNMEAFCRERLRVRHAKLNIWTLKCTWEGAADEYMSKRCQACGRMTNASVLRIPICNKCRFNPKLKWTFMVKTYEARRFATRRQIRDLPYHVGKGGTHLRYWTDIVKVVPGLKDSLRIRMGI